LGHLIAADRQVDNRVAVAAALSIEVHVPAQAVQDDVRHLAVKARSERDADAAAFEVGKQREAAFGGQHRLGAVVRLQHLPKHVVMFLCRTCPHEARQAEFNRPPHPGIAQGQKDELARAGPAQRLIGGAALQNRELPHRALARRAGRNRQLAG
nr:hypothetical protein [Tanacetum cinerariifolium]